MGAPKIVANIFVGTSVNAVVNTVTMQPQRCKLLYLERGDKLLFSTHQGNILQVSGTHKMADRIRQNPRFTKETDSTRFWANSNRSLIN